MEYFLITAINKIIGKYEELGSFYTQEDAIVNINHSEITKYFPAIDGWEINIEKVQRDQDTGKTTRVVLH